MTLEPEPFNMQLETELPLKNEWKGKSQLEISSHEDAEEENQCYKSGLNSCLTMADDCFVMFQYN